MKRILLTGMSGTGKSTVLRMLRDDHTVTIDLDNTEWVEIDPLTGVREFRIQPLLAHMRQNSDKHIVLAGCEANQYQLYNALDAVILMTAPLPVMRERIRQRKENPYGKSNSEWARIVADKEEIEPLLARHCTYICPTDRPLEDVVMDVKRFLR